MELISLYPFDPTGRSPDNKIQNESITVTPPAEIKDYSYVIPRAAPFYADTMVVRDGTGPGSRRLIENVDYWCVIDFLSASHSLQRRVSVGIALLDARYSGTLYVSYQTVGGNYTLADYSILEELIRARYIVKHVSYEQIINLPEGFAPEWHKHQVADMVGMSEVVTSLNGIIAALTEKEASLGQTIVSFNDHLENADAHSPNNVGLGSVKNYGIATVEDVYEGNALKYVTADMLNYYVSQHMGAPSGAPVARMMSVVEEDSSVMITKTTKSRHGSSELDTTWTIQYVPETGTLMGSVVVNNPFVFNPLNTLELNLTSLAQGTVTSLPLLAFNTIHQLGGAYQSFNIYCSESVFKMKDTSCITLGLQTANNTPVTLDSLKVYFTATVSTSSLNTKVLSFLNGIPA